MLCPGYRLSGDGMDKLLSDLHEYIQEEWDVTGQYLEAIGICWPNNEHLTCPAERDGVNFVYRIT